MAVSGFYIVLPRGDFFSGVSSDRDAGYTCTIFEIEFSSIAKAQSTVRIGGAHYAQRFRKDSRFMICWDGMQARAN